MNATSHATLDGLGETRLLLDALRPDATAAGWRDACTRRGADFDRLAVRAIVLGVAPLLDHRLAQLGCDLPPRAAAKLLATRDAHRRRNRAVFDQLGELLAALSGHGVEPIALKGVHLAATVYPDLGTRPMNDIDLLVAPGELPRVSTVLAELGYVGHTTSPRHGAGVTKHTSTFRRPGPPATTPNPYLSAAGDRTVEPHTSLEESWFGLRVDVTPGVRERARAIDLGGHACRGLATEDLVLHLAVHLVFHLIMGQPAMVQLVDLLLVTSTCDVDWSLVTERAGARRAAPFVLAGLGLAVRCVGAPVPATAIAALRRHSPRTLRRRADAIGLADVLRRTQQPPARSLPARLGRGLANRLETLRWARDWHDRWHTGRTLLAWWRSDTARTLLARDGEA